MKSAALRSAATDGSWPRRVVREPLVHFVLLGGLLFGGYNLLNDEPRAGDANRIVVDAAQVTNLAHMFERTWMRPPTRAELSGLVENHIKEEILYREALALGLDRDDLVIRRRMRQKMEFLNTDLLEPAPPTEAELRAYLDAHMDRFRISEQLSFTQVFLKQDSQKRAKVVLQQLAGRLPSELALDKVGDASLLPGVMRQADRQELERVFGKDLVAKLLTAPLQKWSGPHVSPYGLHLVYLSERRSAREPPLAEVRQAVEREWLAARQRDANEAFYQALRQHYTIDVVYPEPPTDDALAAVRR